jgi:hypothetical protein
MAYYAKQIRKRLELDLDSRHWLKTPDGRFLFFTWGLNRIAEGVRSNPGFFDQPVENVRKAAKSFSVMTEKLGLPAAYVYHLQMQLPKPQQVRPFLNAVYDHFPAVVAWDEGLQVADHNKRHRIARELARRRDRTFIQRIHPAFMGSKVYSAKRNDVMYNAKQVMRTDGPMWRPSLSDPALSGAWRQQLRRVVEQDMAMINVQTWNDFFEGHHIAPSLNHNFGFSILLNYYKRRWKGKACKAAIDKEAAIAFYKKHPYDAQGSIAHIPAKPFPWQHLSPTEHAELARELEDRIEIVTLLKEPATLHFRGKRIGRVPAGVHASHFPQTPGPVHARVVRDGEVVVELRSPEWITNAPYRYDRMTYVWSSRRNEIYHEIFGDNVESAVLSEYAEDDDGVPRWKKLYDFDGRRFNVDNMNN